MADRDPNEAGEKAARRFALANSGTVACEIALPGNPGEKRDWLDEFLETGGSGVWEGISNAQQFKATREEEDQERKRQEEVLGLEKLIKAVGGYPWLDRVIVKVHKVGERAWWFKDAPSYPGGPIGSTEISTLFGVVARLKRLDDGTYGKRVIVVGPKGEINVVDVWADDIAAATPAGLLKRLVQAGLSYGPAGRGDVPAIVAMASPTREILIVSRPGWHRLPGRREPVYVAPDGQVIGAPSGTVDLDAGVHLAPHVARGGTLDAWKAAVAPAALSESCSHFLIGLLAGFAGPLVELLQMPTCGLCLTGRTSIGKSTALRTRGLGLV